MKLYEISDMEAESVTRCRMCSSLVAVDGKEQHSNWHVLHDGIEALFVSVAMKLVIVTAE